jgi:hypothetical protein
LFESNSTSVIFHNFQKLKNMNFAKLEILCHILVCIGSGLTRADDAFGKLTVVPVVSFLHELQVSVVGGEHTSMVISPLVLDPARGR